MISAGDLRHRITFQSRQDVQDSNGDMVPDWTDAATVWAKIEPLSARDFIAAQAEQSKVVARITVRHRDIDRGWRIFHDAKIYHIEGVLPDKDSGLEYLTIPVSEGVRDS